MRSRGSESNLIDFDLVDERRRELGLSMRALGQLVGLSGGALAEFAAGASQAGIRVLTVVRLARALQLEPRALLLQPETSGGAPESDDVRLEAALLHSRRRRPLADYERPLGMTHLQLLRAADRLELRLSGTGAELRRHSGFSIQPRGGVLTRQQTKRLLERRTRRPALRLDQVRTLRKALQGELVAVEFDGKLHGGSLPATTGYLLKNGYVRNADGRCVLTDVVCFSLGLKRTLPRVAKRPGACDESV